MREKIMIVDDDLTLLEEMKEALNDIYNVEISNSGSAAVALAKDTMPNIILLDLKMKGKNGFQVADEIKRHPKTAYIPIVAMTAFYTEPEQAMFMNFCGIHGCIHKPFDLDEVRQKIGNILSLKSKN